MRASNTDTFLRTVPLDGTVTQSDQEVSCHQCRSERFLFSLGRLMHRHTGQGTRRFPALERLFQSLSDDDARVLEVRWSVAELLATLRAACGPQVPLGRQSAPLGGAASRSLHSAGRLASLPSPWLRTAPPGLGWRLAAGRPT